MMAAQASLFGCQANPSPFQALLPSSFPPGTDQNVVKCFQMADLDRNGNISDKELKKVLSACNQSFSLRTVHLLIYVFTPTFTRTIGPKEFATVYNGLLSWRGVFDKYDKNQNGKIDCCELAQALQDLGLNVNPLVMDLLFSKFDQTGGKTKSLNYDNFIECCITIKGLTEKFKERENDSNGLATFNFETFLLNFLPFLIA